MLVVTRALYPACWRRRCSSCVNLQTGELWWATCQASNSSAKLLTSLHVLFAVNSSDGALPAGTQARAAFTYSPARRQRLSNTPA